mgnify:CR=1 FL=1
MADSLFPNPHPEEPFREPVAKLAKMITDRAPVVLGIEKITKESPEYIGLSALCTDEMAEIALKMGKRKPRTLEDMVKITGKDKTYLEDMLQKLAVNGVIEYNWENPRHEKQYVLPMFVPGSAEFANMNEDILREHPEMGRFFERMSRVPLEKGHPYGASRRSGYRHARYSCGKSNSDGKPVCVCGTYFSLAGQIRG